MEFTVVKVEKGKLNIKEEKRKRYFQFLLK